MRIVLGVSGGIAAYKAVSLLRLLTEAGHSVTVVPTRAALEFVGAPTWAALSGHPVTSEVFEHVENVRHVALGQAADLVVVAPATADLMARAAHGHADDLLTNVLLTASGTVLMVPAMHTEMWQHAATRANVELLRSRGVVVMEPASGRLTGSDSGPGRLPEPEQIFARVEALLLSSERDLAGRHVVVTAGGTREPLDPVRYLGNRSSGKQGMAVAEDALARGARVTLVAANVDLPAPSGAEVVRVETARDLEAAVSTLAPGADAVVMAAAVADFRPSTYSDAKIKKSYGDGQDDEAPRVHLVRNPDILSGLVADRGSSRAPVLVGFAAETGEPGRSVLDLAREKLARKGCDILVANEVGRDLTFGADASTVHILRRGVDEAVQVGPASKRVTAHAVLDAVVSQLRHRTHP